MNTDKILKEWGYGSNQNFAEIAAQTSKMNFVSTVEMRQWVVNTFGDPAIKQGLLPVPMPYKVFPPEGMDFESGAYDQLKTALRLPVANCGALMPDGHVGYSMPIGGVVSLHNAISPSFVGYDIGCQVALSIFIDISADKLETDINLRGSLMKALLKSTSFGLGAEGMDYEHPVMNVPAWDFNPALKNVKGLAQKQLGSSGAGNHFADIVILTFNSKVDAAPSVRYVGLLTHSGSRGAGNKIGHYYSNLADQETAKYYDIPKGYGWLDLSSSAGQDYVIAMRTMEDYAHANHQIIHHMFAKNSGLEPSLQFCSVHNYATFDGLDVIHRKGAIPAHTEELGLIPGSSGSKSYIVSGLGNEDSLCSASHGAGRARSRSKSKEIYNAGDFNTHMEEMNILYSGVAPDETWNAYKPIDNVINGERALVEVIGVMKPVIVVMGGSTKSDDGD